MTDPPAYPNPQRPNLARTVLRVLSLGILLGVVIWVIYLAWGMFA